MTRIIGALLIGTALLLSAAAGTALAHEKRQVGPYTFEVGFLIEPTYTNHLNAVFLEVVETATKKPVEGLHETLTVEVTAAGRTRSFKLRPLPKQPGQYAADFVPTVHATYVFRFAGKIGDLALDERFESGPNRFDEPLDLAAARFPADDPQRELREAVDQARLLAAAAILVAVALPIALQAWARRR